MKLLRRQPPLSGTVDAAIHGSFTRQTAQPTAVDIPITVNRAKDATTLAIEGTEPAASGLYLLRFHTANGMHQPAIKVLIE